MTDAPQQARQLDRLELACLGYLVLPLVVFISTWLRWPVMLGLGALLGLSLWEVTRRTSRSTRTPISLRLWLLLAVVAAVWVGLSGLAGGLPLNRDWGIRMVVLRDLTVGSWPLSYGPVEGGEAVLRFSLGYYLVPALVGQWIGVAGARAMQALWTFGGVLLFFALVLSAWPPRPARTVALLLAVLVFFSGIDIVGWWMDCACLPAYGQHIEWWNAWMQYSSQTTLLFWVPNHALPAWLLTSVVWRHRHTGLALAPTAALLLAAALWSPLVCIGLAPLMLACSLRGQVSKAWWQELAHPAVLAVLPITLLIAKFVTFGMPPPAAASAALTAPPTDHFAFTQASLSEWLRFAVLEWGALAFMLAVLAGGARRLPWYFWIAILELAVLPLWSFGPGNDWVMRGGIAPLTLLMLITADTLTQTTQALKWRTAVLALLLLGGVTPLMEMQRASLPGSQWPDDGRNLAQRAGLPWHYVGVLSPGWMAWALRPPVLLPTPSPATQGR